MTNTDTSNPQILTAIGGFFVRRGRGEWVVWGPMGLLAETFVGKYSGHRTAQEALAAARARQRERIAYEQRSE